MGFTLTMPACPQYDCVAIARSYVHRNIDSLLDLQHEVYKSGTVYIPDLPSVLVILSFAMLL